MGSIELIVLAALGFSSLWQIFYWLFFMFRIRRKPRNLAAQLPDVSIIVCARNEEAVIGRLVEAIVGQQYAANKQIVIVDDCSSDDTPLIIAQLRARYPEVYTTTIPGDSVFTHGKKLALTVGIKAAVYNHLVFIDADCVPASEHWLTSLMEGYAAEGKQLVLGYGRYAKYSGLLNLFIRYETFWNAVQYIGFASALKPFMGVGRNLSYTKELFDKSSKFRRNITLLSGDDDLFVSEMGTRANTASVFIAEAHTVSEPKRSWKAYSAQKSRHLTTASYYPGKVCFWLVSELLSRVLFWVLAVGTLIAGLHYDNDILLWSATGVLVLRTLIMYISLGISAKNMGEGLMWILCLPFDIMVPCVQAAAWITGSATKSRNTWK